MVMDKLVDMHGQVSVILAVVISFRDKESVSIQNCLDKVFVCLMNICAVGSAEDETLNMMSNQPFGSLLLF